MCNAADRLRELVSDDKVRIIPELHDCASVKVAEMNKFEVIMVNSGDLACALTEVPDLQLLSIDDFCQITDRIANMTQMPLTIDTDGGFGFDHGLSTYVGYKRIMEASTVGVLVTDTSELRRAGQLPIEDAVLRFKVARDDLDTNDHHGFLVTRYGTNPGKDFDDCVTRLKVCQEAGADMLCILQIRGMKGDKYELCEKLRDVCNCPMWHPDICGAAHSPYKATMEQLKDLGNYKLAGVHYSIHAAMLAMLDIGRHVIMEQNNNYVGHHFDDTGYKCFTIMSMFGLTNKYWVDLKSSYVKEPQDSTAQRNYDCSVRPDDVHNPDKKKR